ncbi:MAG: toll/interleukin-1 receptor domain-containing protein, partial [Bacteroidota bacterium]
MSNHIFVSYSRRDSNMLAKIASLLEKDGFEVWTDNNLVAGTPSWKNAIEQAIQDCFCVVILMSPGSKKSEWVERELDYAYILKKRIFPVLVDGSAQSAIPFELINIQYVDLRVDFDDQFDSLCDAIRLYQESNPLAYPKPENSNQFFDLDL